DVHRAPDIPWVQISFNVRRKKFEFATSEKKLAEAQSGGWMVCRPRNATWTIFIDGMTVPNRRVHERVLLLYRNGALITLVGRYYDLELSTSRDNPASVAPVQHGAVIARMVSESELRGSIDTLRLSCEGQRNGTDLFKFQQQ
ncbi:MAG TPA: hypothetical protein VJS66_01300, partial [Burkholderiales bacterium]|nr:hypothetical protein [Burkholderiales bacterium]